MDDRTQEEREESRRRFERYCYIEHLSKNRRNRLEQYQKAIGRELTLDEIKARFGGGQDDE